MSYKQSVCESIPINSWNVSKSIPIQADYKEYYKGSGEESDSEGNVKPTRLEGLPAWKKNTVSSLESITNQYWIDSW